MFQGFYDLAAGMITQNRNMNVISNNMANVSTPGYKSDRIIESTFRDELIYRYDRAGKTPIGTVSRINTAAERVTDYTEGGLLQTDRALDFGIQGDGFFAIQTNNGVVYSRNGSFNLDNNGYLVLPGVGRVLGENGPIRLTTDDVTVDRQGNIVGTENGQYYGRLRVVDFADYGQLTKITGGVFRAAAQPVNANGAKFVQGYVEGSNVSMMDEMVNMMSGQRTLQSSAQMLKMYDRLIEKAAQTGSI